MQAQPNNPTPPSSTTTTTPRPAHQPSSFPFLVVTGLLFYFFSKSPTSSDSHSRNVLTRALHQRQLELAGLNQFLNLTERTKPTQPSNSSSSQPIPITPQLAYPPIHSFGTQSISRAHQFILQWYDQLNSLPSNSPYLYWNNITGHLKGNWKVDTQTFQWYPPSDPHLNNITHQNHSSNVFQNSSYFQSQRGKFNWLSPNNLSTPLLQNSSSYPPTQKIGFNLRESHREQVRSNTSILRGSMYISSTDSKDVVLEVEGVHFHDQGKFYLRGIPNQGYLDTRIHLSSALDIPEKDLNSNFNPDNSSIVLNVAQATPQQIRIGHAIVSDFENRIQRIQQILKKSDFSHEGDDRDSSEDDQKSNCTFLIYGGLKPITSTTDSYLATRLLEEYERSLIEPTGATIPTPPEPIFKSLLISPNCGLVLESNEMEILLSPKIRKKGTNYSWVAGAVGGFQCWLLVWQMDSRQSPSSLSRMSYFALVAQIIMDAWMFSSHLTLAVITNSNLSTQALLIPAFFACLNGILFGMRYSTLIRLHTPSSSSTTTSTDLTTTSTINNNNNNVNNRTTLGIGGDSDYVQVPNPPTDPPGSPTSTPVLPSNTTTSNPSRIRTWFSKIKHFFTNRPLVSLTFIGLSFFIIPFFIYSWQPLMLTILYSYWIPQIIHNVQNGTSRRGLRKRYVLGTTLSRLFLPLYVWGCPKNVLFVDMKRMYSFEFVLERKLLTSPENGLAWIRLISLYSITQAIIIILQDYLGSRFFLYGGIFKYEAGWDYHPIKLPTVQDLEDGTEEGTTKKIIRECVICFEPIDDLPAPATSSTTSASNVNLPDLQASSFNTSSFGSSLGFRSHSTDHHHSLFSRWSVMVPPCLHIAHTKCLENWLAIKSECPVCRRPLPPI